MIDKLIQYFSFPFVRYALVVGVLVALCSSLLGVTLVLRRYSYIGDGLSHVAFGAMAVATVANLTNNMFIVIPVTVAAAILLLGNTRRKISGDAAIAMISVGALALGYMLINVFSKSANISGDVCSTLFGSTSILTLSFTDVMISVVLSAVVILLFVLCYHRIFAVTFDETFARATGVSAKLYNILLAVITAFVIVLAMNLVGSLLISALVVFPALSAMRLFRSFRSVIICSAAISVACAALGIVFSILFSTPTGATIVAADIIAYAALSAVGYFTKGRQ